MNANFTLAVRHNKDNCKHCNLQGTKISHFNYLKVGVSKHRTEQFSPKALHENGFTCKN